MNEARVQPPESTEPRVALLIGRILSALVPLAWGALAATQALAGWTLAVCVLTVMFVLMLTALALYGRIGTQDALPAEGVLLFVISICIVLIAPLMAFLLKAWPMPRTCAAWTMIMTSITVWLLFRGRWLTRVVVLICSCSGATLALIAGISFVWVSLEQHGDPLAGMRMLPSESMRLAAVTLVTVSPFSLIGSICVIRHELP